MTKEERIKEEIEIFKSIYKNIPKNEYETVLKFIENLAFMSITLDDLMVTINNSELIVQSVRSMKEHPAITSYNKVYANYLKGIQYLTSLLPKETKNVIEDDSLMEFIKNKNSRK